MKRALSLFLLGLSTLGAAAERTVGASIWCDTRMDSPVQMVIVEDVTFEDGKPFTATGSSTSNGHGSWDLTYDAKVTLAEEEKPGSASLLHFDLKPTKWDAVGSNNDDDYAVEHAHIFWDTFSENGVGFFRSKAGRHMRLICVVGWHTKKKTP